MKIFLLLLFHFSVYTGYTQTIEEILEKNTRMMGGVDSFNKLSSIKITGTISTDGLSIHFTEQILNGKGLRYDAKFEGVTITRCYYNGKAWEINSSLGHKSPVAITGDELEALKSRCIVANELMAHGIKDEQLKLLGKEVIEGTEAFNIGITYKSGTEASMFISTEDYSIIKTVFKKKDQKKNKAGSDSEIWYSDLEEFEGLKFIMTRSTKLNGKGFQTTKYDNIELNIPIDEKIFEMK